MSKFFNSVWFRCIAFLLVLSAILSGLLAVLNTVLYVSPEERTARAVSKIYGEMKEYATDLDVDAGDTAIEYKDVGKINKIYVVGDAESDNYDTLFQVTGYQGYKNGTITLWVKVSFAENKSTITSVIIESYEKQTLMSKLDGSYTNGFLVDVTDSYKNGELFFADSKHSSAENYNPVTGATYSAQAGNNAVNCVVMYIGGAQ